MASNKPLLIVGAGGYGRTVAEAARLCDAFEPVGFLDDGFPEKKEVMGLPVLGDTRAIQKAKEYAGSAVVAIGDNRVRQSLLQGVEDAGFELSSIVHPQAFIAESVVLGPGVTVMAGAVVNAEARLGRGVIVNAGTVVDHHAAVEPFAHLGAGCSVAGGNRVAEGVWLRAGCVLGYRSETEAWKVYGPGSVFGE